MSKRLRLPSGAQKKSTGNDCQSVLCAGIRTRKSAAKPQVTQGGCKITPGRSQDLPKPLRDIIDGPKSGTNPSSKSNTEHVHDTFLCRGDITSAGVRKGVHTKCLETQQKGRRASPEDEAVSDVAEQARRPSRTRR